MHHLSLVVSLVYWLKVETAGVSGKAALTRTHSKTCRKIGGSLTRDASWSACAPAPLSHRTSTVAQVEKFCLKPSKCVNH